MNASRVLDARSRERIQRSLARLQACRNPFDPLGYGLRDDAWQQEGERRQAATEQQAIEREVATTVREAGRAPSLKRPFP